MKTLFALLLSIVVTAVGAQSPQNEPGSDPDSVRAWSAFSANNYSAALTSYRKAAARNHALAQFNLGVMLIQGLGAESSPKEGVAWLRKAANNNLPRAQYVLASLHERGEHVNKSMTEATMWYRKAAERGFRDAQVSLATQYFLGRGVSQDYKQAANWYELAAAQGDRARAT